LRSTSTAYLDVITSRTAAALSSEQGGARTLSSCVVSPRGMGEEIWFRRGRSVNGHVRQQRSTRWSISWA